jgi:hypothetical protein
MYPFAICFDWNQGIGLSISRPFYSVLHFESIFLISPLLIPYQGALNVLLSLWVCMVDLHFGYSWCRSYNMQGRRVAAANDVGGQP